MSEIQKRETSAELMLAPETMAEALKNPLRLLPQELRINSMQLWAMTRHLAGLETAFALAAPMARWLQTTRMTPKKLNSILERMLSPERMKDFKFASDVTTTLAEIVHYELTKNAGMDIIPQSELESW